ncbi:MAG: S8 family serine peptidase, partial [bacterium]|nr:S8 family serine peptidase [bacterium]
MVRTEPEHLDETIAKLNQRGVSVVKVISPEGVLVTGGEADLEALEGIGDVRQWAGNVALTPELKYLSRRTVEESNRRVGVVAAFVAHMDLTEIRRQLEESGAEISWVEQRDTTVEVGLRVRRDQMASTTRVLEQSQGLAWADVQPAVRLQNSASVWRCQSGFPFQTSVFDNGLHGEGQVVAVLDTGLDADNCYFWDDEYGLPVVNDDTSIAINPLHRKVLAVNFFWELDWPNPDEFAWDDAGHGTHVAGSVASDGGILGQHDGTDGMAPAAKLVIQDGGAARDDCADLPGLGCPLRPLEPVLEQTYLQGARIHTNSWGDEENFYPRGRYTERTADVDRFTWNHKDFLTFFAAGNAGSEGDGSVISPATGKNVVAVGATERGNSDPLCPISFSSRGWTHDGRIKPDVLAPGTSIWSARSDGSISTNNCDDQISSGTSMATPTAAGLAALVRQYFVDGFYPTGTPHLSDRMLPSAALVKATLIASAVGVRELGCSSARHIPSPDQGWGVIQLDRALHFPGDA